MLCTLLRGQAGQSSRDGVKAFSAMFYSTGWNSSIPFRALSSFYVKPLVLRR